MNCMYTLQNDCVAIINLYNLICTKLLSLSSGCWLINVPTHPSLLCCTMGATSCAALSC